jgi:hypothetical protein
VILSVALWLAGSADDSTEDDGMSADDVSDAGDLSDMPGYSDADAEGDEDMSECTQVEHRTCATAGSHLVGNALSFSSELGGRGGGGGQQQRGQRQWGVGSKQQISLHVPVSM